MEIVLQGSAIAIIGALFAVFLRRYDGAFAALVTLGCGCVILYLLISILSPILAFLERLREAAGIASPVLHPLLKSVAIGLLVNVAVTICADTGNSAVGSVVRLLGTAASIYIALPLLEAVLDLVTNMMGG